MPYQPVLFTAQSSLHDSEPQSTPSRLVNMFPESTTTQEQPILLRSCPGRTAITTVTGAVRAMIGDSTTIYLAAGGRLWSFDGTTATNLGAIADDVSTTLAQNPTQVAVVAGGNYYIYDGATVTEVTGLAFTSMGSVDFMDGFFLLTELDGARHAISALNDGTSLNALDFASAEYTGSA